MRFGDDWLIKQWPASACHGPTPKAWIDWVRRHRGIDLPNCFTDPPEPPAVALKPLQPRIALPAADLATAQGFAA